MTEAAPAVPTFKLVLVGDGGTGKVCRMDLLSVPSVEDVLQPHIVLPRGRDALWHRSTSNNITDYVRQASFDRRIREEVYRDTWCRSPPFGLQHGMFISYTCPTSR